eukprot:scaffold127424_cov32-Tisochrysis_lutea.AAC.1
MAAAASIPLLSAALLVPPRLGGIAAPIRAELTVPYRTATPCLDLGFQVDAGASFGSVFVLCGFIALQLRIRSAEDARATRDDAIEALRLSQGALLAGTATADDVRASAAAALEAAASYDRARQVFRLPGALLRIPDPTAEQSRRLLAPYDPTLQAQKESAAAAESALSTGSPQSEDQLENVRRALGLRDTAEQGKSSLLPSGSNTITFKDVAIAFVFLLQIGWCAFSLSILMSQSHLVCTCTLAICRIVGQNVDNKSTMSALSHRFLLSLTDPIGAPGPMLNLALTSGGEMVDQLEARRAAQSSEYAAMLEEAVASGQAPPFCASRPLSDGLGGCTGATGALHSRKGEEQSPGADPVSLQDDPEFLRTRGLDANRGWISGPLSKTNY